MQLAVSVLATLRATTLSVLAMWIASTQVATAARLDVLASTTSIRPGDALSITVAGDSEGATDELIRVLLAYDGPIEPSNAPGPFVLNTNPPSEYPGATWTALVQTGRCDVTPAGTCVAVDAASSYFFPIFGPSLELLPSTLSVFAFDTSAALPGSTLTFQALPDGFGFFLGGPSGIVSVHVIPEPASAALLGLGLIVAALLQRSRHSPCEAPRSSSS